ncbi:MAG: hypothetical protein HY865_04225 [Chloroflexi bacterium]|nr:hypothetical protein [Chloroflexota bacterium]
MDQLRPKLKYLAIPLSAYLGLIVVVALVLLISDTFSLFSLGKILMYLGLGIAVLGLAFANFWRTSVDVHVRHQGTLEEKRQRAKTDVSDFNIGFAVILVGVILCATGWLMADVAVCGRLIC